MPEGRIVQEGTPDMIMHHPVSNFIANFTAMDNIFTGIGSIHAIGKSLTST